MTARRVLLPAARSVRAERGPVAVCVRLVPLGTTLGVHTGVWGLYTAAARRSPAKRRGGSEGTLARLLARTQAAVQRRAAGGPSHLWVVPA